MADLNIIKPIGVQNLINKFCYTIGMLPTSYKDSLTYEEQILAIGNYLETTVYPAINNNAEALTELQGLFVALHDYVENYFENLDVTDEINAKLDEMAEDGTLAEIIEDYTTIPQLTERVTTLEDVTVPAVSERVTTLEDVTVPAVSERVTNLENITSERAIFIGDSYGVGTTNTSEVIDSWVVYLKQKLGLDNTNSYTFVENGAGFVAVGVDSHTFSTLLSTNADLVTNKESITKIICCGGFNDRTQNVQSAIQSFMTYCKEVYPNAKVYIGMIGATNQEGTTGDNYRYDLYNNCLASYKRCTLYGATYLSGVENALKDYTYLSNDHQHPNADGYKSIASFIYNALNSGKNDFYGVQNAGTLTLPSNATGGQVNTNTQRVGEFTSIQIVGDITFSPTTIYSAHDLTLGQFSDKNFRFSKHTTLMIPCYFKLESSTDSAIFRTGYINITGATANNCHLFFNDTSMNNMNKLTIISASATIPTNIT